MLKKIFVFFIFLGLSNIIPVFAADEIETNFKGNVRPISALQIERAKEEGIDPALLVHEIASETTQEVKPIQKPVTQKQDFSNRPLRPRPGNVNDRITDPFRSIDEDELRFFIIPDDLKGLHLLSNIGDYVRYEDTKMDFNNIAVNYAFSNMKVLDFSLSPISRVNLVIINGTILVQGTDDITVNKDYHTINVIGRENRFQVIKKVTISSNGLDGGLFLAEGAELIFEFINDGSTTPEVFLADEFVMNMPKNAILRFEGEGIVKFGNGARINLNGDRAADKYENVTFANKPAIHVSEQAAMTVNRNATSTISGIGTVIISNGGKILINEPGHLIFGHEIEGTSIIDYPYMGLAWWNDSTRYHRDEDVKRMYFEKSSEAMLDIKVIDSGLIQVENTTPYSSSKISIAYAKSTLEFTQGGMLAIKDGGTFEVNVNDNELADGILSTFSFGLGGKFVIDDTGKLLMAANHMNSLDKDDLGHTKEFYVNWTAKDATVGGDGLIGYLDDEGSNDRSFTGKFQPLNAGYEKTDEEIEKLSEKLVNTNIEPDVNVTVLYTGADDKRYFRTVNGYSVEIQLNYFVVSDDSTIGSAKYGYVTVVNAIDGDKLVYNANGVLQ